MKIQALLPLRWAALLSGLMSIAADGNHFIGLTNFSNFSSNIEKGGNTITSGWLSPTTDWQELIVSWNAGLPKTGGMKVEVRVMRGTNTSPYYTMGLWAPEPGNHYRESVKGQKDEWGVVDTDTLILRQPSGPVQLRITMYPPESRLKFVGLSFYSSSVITNIAPVRSSAWGQELAVPERSQMAFPQGGAWCSPTSTSMVLAFWADKLSRPDLNKTVPEVAAGVNDPNWPGTGNWAFNMAFAGALPGMRAYVTRLDGIEEIERWIESRVPVVASVAYGILKGKQTTDGHLIVVTGFTDDGRVIVNDPGTRLNVRKEFSRESFLKAWDHSKRTVYLIHPEHMRDPASAGIGSK